MGTFSIWHWIIVLSLFGAPVIAVALANRDKTLSRLPYFWRIAGLLLIGGFLGFYVEGQSTGPSATGVAILALMWIVALVVLSVLGMLWSVHRIQEIGRSRWWTLLLLVPAINLLFIVVLILYPGREIGGQGGKDAAMV